MSGNQLKNGDFESGSLSPWHTQGVFVTESVSMQGNRAAMLKGEVANAYLLQTIPIQPDTEYELEVWLATDGASRSAPVSISVTYYREDGLFLDYGLIKYIQPGRLPTAGQDHWFHVKETAAAPSAEATQAIVLINRLPIESTAAVYVDQISFQKIERAKETDSPDSRPVATHTAPQAVAYVANSFCDKVSVLDVASMQVITHIFVGSDPMGVVFSPDGKRVFVTNYGDNSVSVIDAAASRQIETIQVGHGPSEMAIHPNGRIGYVCNLLSSTISVLDLDRLAISGTIQVHADSIVLSPEGATLYASQRSQDSLAVIETISNTVVGSIPANKSPHGMAISPDGKRLYVTNSGANQTVTVMDTASGSIITTIQVGHTPTGIAINREGTRLYVAVSGDAALAVINLSTITPEATIPLESTPEKIALSPDGKQVFVTEMISNQVSIINTETLKVEQIIPLELGPDGIAVGQLPKAPDK